MQYFELFLEWALCFCRLHGSSWYNVDVGEDRKSAWRDERYNIKELGLS